MKKRDDMHPTKGLPSDQDPYWLRKDCFLRAAEEAGEKIFEIDQRYGEFSSAHEAYAVIKEELDEFWEIVKRKKGARDLAEMRAELMDIAAAALRHAAQLDWEIIEKGLK